MHPRTLARLASLSTHLRRAPRPSCSSAMSTSSSIPLDNTPLNFATSAVPENNSLGEQRHIKTAAALIIGCVACSVFTNGKLRVAVKGRNSQWKDARPKLELLCTVLF